MKEIHKCYVQLTFLVLALELLDEVVDKTVVEVLQAGPASIMGGAMHKMWDTQEMQDA